MNQQELFEYIKKQYPATPERITQNGKQITIFKNQRNNIPYAIFYQSDESVMSIMEVQAESDMISNYIEMYHLAPAKYMNQKHWLTVPMDGTVRDSKVLDMIDMGYDIVDEQEKKQNTVAEVLVKCLENEGVKYVFGIPGEENLDMMNALEKSDIRVIVVRHEQGAAFMADMYGRLTGKAGVCFSTLGPGATNLITGTADANSDGAPLIAITGQVGTERMHLTSHQYLDLVELFAPITKRSKQIVNPNSVNEIVRIAFKYAESEKPGACHVDLPTNVAKLPVSSGIAARHLKKPERDKEYASFSSIDQAAAMIFKAKHPVILVGHSAVRNHAGEALTSFADVLKIPVVNTMMAKGIIPYNNKYSLTTACAGSTGSSTSPWTGKYCVPTR